MDIENIFMVTPASFQGVLIEHSFPSRHAAIFNRSFPNIQWKHCKFVI